MKKSRLQILNNSTIRIFDIFFAIFFLFFFSPLFLFSIIAIKIFSSGPIFFKQFRYGQNFKQIQIIKFRTMKPGSEKFETEKIALLKEPNIQTKNDERITWIGKFLRRFSIDELPQFWLVLKGEMSIVGPRPLIDVEIKKIDQKYQDRYQVLPGVTGLAQVSGRAKLTTKQALEYDLEWVKKYSLKLYCKILGKTFYVGVLPKQTY
jgi:lipopolysaccharide/colanic/teichoic acid biosynthesis glycosyltransferase